MDLPFGGRDEEVVHQVDGLGEPDVLPNEGEIEMGRCVSRGH